MRIFRIYLFLMFACSIPFLTGCDNGTPLGKLYDPSSEEVLSSSWGEWVLYDDVLRTRGSMMFLSSSDEQEVSFDCRENPFQGNHCLKYSWTGGRVYDSGRGIWQSDWCGFSLIVAPDYGQFDSFTADLTPGAYAKITFRARGTLSAHTYLRLESPLATWESVSPTKAWQGTVGDEWQKYEFTPGSPLSGIKEFVRIILKYDDDGNPQTENTTTGTGGTVFIDDIRYEK